MSDNPKLVLILKLSWGLQDNVRPSYFMRNIFSILNPPKPKAATKGVIGGAPPPPPTF